MNKVILTGILLVTALMVPLVAMAQTIVGRAVVDGKVALLFDNGTWTYQDEDVASVDGCKIVAAKVEFCGQAAGWVETPTSTTEINAAYRIDARHYAQYLIEELGTDDGLNAEFMRTIVLSNAKSFAGQDAEVIDVVPATLGDLSGETIIYRVLVNGVEVIFANSIFLTTDQAMQIMTYAIATEYSPEHVKMQSDFLSFTKVAP